MKKILYTLLLLMICIGVSFGQTFKIITNSSNSATSITQKDASDYFLKKKAKWSDGTAVKPIDLSSSSKVRESFSQQIHGKSTAAIRSFWQQAIFSGAASAPPEKENDTEVIEYVKRTAGAIGYVSASANTEGVKTISVN
jgi:ABC-type phosphate transport system substrate-binding protein